MPMFISPFSATIRHGLPSSSTRDPSGCSRTMRFCSKSSLGWGLMVPRTHHPLWMKVILVCPYPAVAICWWGTFCSWTNPCGILCLGVQTCWIKLIQDLGEETAPRSSCHNWHGVTFSIILYTVSMAECVNMCQPFTSRFPEKSSGPQDMWFQSFQKLWTVEKLATCVSSRDCDLSIFQGNWDFQQLGKR